MTKDYLMETLPLHTIPDRKREHQGRIAAVRMYADNFVPTFAFKKGLTEALLTKTFPNGWSSETALKLWPVVNMAQKWYTALEHNRTRTACSLDADGPTPVMPYQEAVIEFLKEAPEKLTVTYDEDEDNEDENNCTTAKNDKEDENSMNVSGSSFASSEFLASTPQREKKYTVLSKSTESKRAVKLNLGETDGIVQEK